VFKIMTWNLENLFRPGAPSGPRSEAAYQAKLQGLASVINEQAPDLAAVQEIGDPDALADLVGLLTGAWQTQISTHPDERQIRVAWLAQRAMSDVEEVVAFANHLQAVQVDDDGATLAAMGRGALAITVQLDSGDPVRLVTTHLKSKLLTFPGGRFQPHDEDERARFAAYALYRRAAEAATLRVWATAALGGTGQNDRVILTGDLNDTVQAATTQLLLGPPGSEIGTPGFDRPDKGDQQRLWNLAPLMPEGKNYSRIYEGRHELIDHILVSAAVVKPIDAITVEAIVSQPLPSISTDPNARRDEPSSDHAPVVATFSEL
jgi:endonuclease/exonuclease/phosphatase family metal-dependent hydrolase